MKIYTDSVVAGTANWLAEQETLCVLQNPDLMAQIALSLKTHGKGRGKLVTQEQQDEIDRA